MDGQQRLVAVLININIIFCRSQPSQVQLDGCDLPYLFFSLFKILLSHLKGGGGGGAWSVISAWEKVPENARDCVVLIFVFSWDILLSRRGNGYVNWAERATQQ